MKMHQMVREKARLEALFTSETSALDEQLSIILHNATTSKAAQDSRIAHLESSLAALQRKYLTLSGEFPRHP